jgi:predicted RecA/RadA family phage recombinase
MKNYIQSGDSITVAAPYVLTAGQGAKIGQLFGVALADAANGAQVVLNTVGVYDLVKAASQAWSVGALIYWDNANKNCTTTATANLLIGTAMTAVGGGAGETVGRVRLNGVSRADGA